MGRPLVWAGLLFVGVPVAVVAVLLEGILTAVTHLPIPVALSAPLVFLLLFWRRLRRKLNGEPFAICLPEFFMDDMTALLIPRAHRHFRALVMLEVLMWGSVIACQLGIIWIFYTLP